VKGACSVMLVISCVEVRDPHWIAVARVADVCERPLCMSVILIPEVVFKDRRLG
jgi:hypothetical protein